jgi:hypothetical protein
LREICKRVWWLLNVFSKVSDSVFHCVLATIGSWSNTCDFRSSMEERVKARSTEMKPFWLSLIV